MTPPVQTPTVAGATPLAITAMVGLGSYGLISTGLMLTCHVQLGYGQCSEARQTWGEQTAAIGVGFGLLFTSSPSGMVARLRGGAAAIRQPEAFEPEQPANPVDRWAAPPPPPPVRPAWAIWRNPL